LLQQFQPRWSPPSYTERDVGISWFADSDTERIIVRMRPLVKFGQFAELTTVTGRIRPSTAALYPHA
jgi:hypothetical protein